LDGGEEQHGNDHTFHEQLVIHGDEHYSTPAHWTRIFDGNPLFNARTARRAPKVRRIFAFSVAVGSAASHRTVPRAPKVRLASVKSVVATSAASHRTARRVHKVRLISVLSVAVASGAAYGEQDSILL
jgi:hypothetical protein